MILIADSGSTKTDWRLIDDEKKIQSFSSIGLNPYFLTTPQIAQEIGKQLVKNIDNKAVISDLKIYFYGAGCSSKETCMRVEQALQQNFPNSTIEVNHDLLAAARALCGNTEGIAAILGTGSNSCHYDGKKILQNVPSLGYVLGDEGSGAHIGKAFIAAFLSDELPVHLAKDFQEKHQLSRSAIFENIYQKPLPNKFLASFSKYVLKNITDTYLTDLVTNCFMQFFDKHICKYDKHRVIPFNCVGSVGFHYSSILKTVATAKQVTIGKIIETPIDGLIEQYTKTT